MLILTRKLNESIIIGDDVTITVIAIEKGYVKLGVEAPKEISVHRQEIYAKIQDENKKAAATKKSDLLRLTKDWKETNQFPDRQNDVE